MNANPQMCNNNDNNVNDDICNELAELKKKEVEYIHEISNLRQVIVKQEKEFDDIKDQFIGIINELKAENQKMQEHLAKVSQNYKHTQHKQIQQVQSCQCCHHHHHCHKCNS